MKIYDALIIGSGAAGFSTADWLYKYNIQNIAIVTENINFGTSRNTGSDKQTYYKLSLTSNDDSVLKMAKSLYDGGMDGKTALIEAATSVRCFMRLVEYGVPFPTNDFGVYVGYQTDHDDTRRATSIGPLTSKVMTEKLETRVMANATTIFDKHIAIKILNNADGVFGLICFDIKNKKIEVIFSKNIILATGGQGAIYKDSVYPKCQNGATNLALDINASLANFSEWQYGLGSVKFRWNLSGSYQQVMPRYISIDAKGNKCEFLRQHIDDTTKLCEIIFLKGYQWPFDYNKLNDSSVIDYLVYKEIYKKHNKVYLDFTKNPSDYDFDTLPIAVKSYLINSDAVLATPIERLKKLNPQAIDLYKTNGIDLETELLEIAVNAQHNNGGVKVDENWESDIKGLFAVGEVAGTFGIYRPGGSALNSTQVGGLRIAEYLSKHDRTITIDSKKTTEAQKDIETFIDKSIGSETTLRLLDDIKRDMSAVAGVVRDKCEIEKFLSKLISFDDNFSDLIKIDSRDKVADLFRGYSNLTTSIALLTCILQTMEKCGSRGSAIFIDNGKIVDENPTYRDFIPVYKDSKITFEKRNPIPLSEEWFESILNK